MLNRARIALVLALSATFHVATPARAAPGALDTSFGRSGKQTAFPSGATAYALAIDHHDRIDVVGSTVSANPNIAIARFLPNGELDRSFGRDGKVVTDLGADEYAFDVGLQSDGRIVVAGERDTRARRVVAIVRYRPDGELDPTFGSGGVVLARFGKRLQGATAVAIDRRNRIVVAGAVSGGLTSRSLVARFLPNGRRDPSFGNHGKVSTDIGRSDERFLDVCVLPDRRIVAAGYAERHLLPEIAAVRYRSDGVPDPTFGTNGVVTTDVSRGADRANALVVQDDGDLLLAGRAGAGAGTWALVRYGPKGHLDPTFGAGGLVLGGQGASGGFADAVALQPNGRIVVVGRVGDGSRADWGAARLRLHGGLDPPFGANGRVATDFFSAADVARDVVIDGRGRIVVAGETLDDGTRRFALVRYLPR